MGIAASIYSGAPALVREKIAKLGPKWDHLHPIVRERAQRVLDDANAEFADDGLRVGMFDGWRDLDEQAVHIGAGASFVSATLDSYHVWGLAVDFVFLDRFGRWTWLPDPENPDNRAYRDPRWYRLGKIIERHGFEWGGRWPKFDGPHGQASDLTTVSALRSMFRTPDDYVAQFATA